MTHKPHTAERHADDLHQLVERVRQACVDAALTAYLDASADGLCAEGAWECAVDAMRHVELTALLQPPSPTTDDQTSMR